LPRPPRPETMLRSRAYGKSAYIVGLVSTDASEEEVTKRVDAAFRRKFPLVW